MPSIDLNWISVDRTHAQPLYRQISDQLRQAILSGRLAPGTVLPSSRNLAAELGVSRNTTVQAYDQLTAESLIEAHQGSGTRIAMSLTDRPAETLAEIGALLQSIPPETGIHVQEHYEDEPTALSFQPGIPAYDAFPSTLWGRLLKRQAGRSDPLLLHYAHIGGYVRLRLELAKYLYGSRGVACEPDQVIITTSARAAIEAIARTLLPPEAVVAVEDPGHLAAKNVLRAAGYQLQQVPVDDRGIRIGDILSGRPQASGVYLTPAHQMPTGVTLSAERRIKLLNWANQTGAWLLEDDYDSEFRFDSSPVAPLHAYGGGQVIFIGTFSKTLAPSIRTAYFVVPPELAKRFESVVFQHGVEPALHVQAALADFLAEGHFTRHIARMRKLYALRRRLLVRALKDTFGNQLRLECPPGGLQIIAHLPDHISAAKIARLAAKADLVTRPMSAYLSDRPARNALHLGFAAVKEDDMMPQVQRLHAAISHVL